MMDMTTVVSGFLVRRVVVALVVVAAAGRYSDHGRRRKGTQARSAQRGELIFFEHTISEEGFRTDEREEQLLYCTVANLARLQKASKQQLFPLTRWGANTLIMRRPQQLRVTPASWSNMGDDHGATTVLDRR